jgi:hypothetical protein
MLKIAVAVLAAVHAPRYAFIPMVLFVMWELIRSFWRERQCNADGRDVPLT